MELNCRNGRECIEELGPVWSLSRSDLLAEASDLMAVRHRRWGALQGHRAVRSGEVAFMAWLARPGYPTTWAVSRACNLSKRTTRAFEAIYPVFLDQSTMS